MHRFANPTRFLGLISAIKPWAAGLCLLTFAAGLYFALFASPPDYQQSETVRIMYVHVPAAWMAMFCYSAGGSKRISTNLAASRGRHGGQSDSANRGSVYPPGARYRVPMGQTHVGNLVGLGC